MPTRVHMGRLDAITGGTNQFGLYVAGPDGTVIIDGTSDIFRIVATGTIESGTLGGAGSVDVDLSLGLGLTDPCAHSSFLDSGSTSVPLPRVQINGTTGVVDFMWRTLTYQSGTATVLRVRAQSTGGALTGNTVRYYLYEQVGI